MAATAGYVALSMFAGMAASQILAPKPDKPGSPTPVPTVTEAEADKQGRDAQKRQRLAAAAATGRADTILTQGLGDVGAGNAATKTLLGM